MIHPYSSLNQITITDNQINPKDFEIKTHISEEQNTALGLDNFERQYRYLSFWTQKIKSIPLHAALHRAKIIAEKLISEMESKSIPLSLEEKWIKKILENDTSFPDEEFTSLSSKTKRIVSQIANNFNNLAFVTRVNSLGIKIPNYSVKSPNIIFTNMDVATQFNDLLAFLKQLRSKNKFLSEEELINLNTHYTWCSKSSREGDIQRFLGRRHLSQTIKTLDLKHIKVPKKIIIMNSTNDEFLNISMIEYSRRLISLTLSNTKTFNQYINEKSRYLTKEEILELFEIIEKSNFVDINLHNIIINDEGVWIIDTEFKSFEGNIDWWKMYRLKPYISEEDLPMFIQCIETKISSAASQKQNNPLTYSDARTYLTCGYFRNYSKEFLEEFTHDIEITGSIKDFRLRSFTIPTKFILE